MPYQQALALRAALARARRILPPLVSACDLGYARHYTAGSLFAPLMLRAGKRWVLEVNSLPDVEQRKNSMGLARRVFSRWVGRQFRRSVRRADALVAVTAQLRNTLVTRYARRAEDIRVIANGVDVGAYATVPPAAERSALRTKLGVPPDTPVVGFIGNLASWQRLDVLLSEWPQIRDAVPAAHALIVGGGSQATELRAAVKRPGLVETVHVTGPVAGSQMSAYLHVCDVALELADVDQNASLIGSCAIKLLTYLAAGRAIVSSPYPGLEFLAEEDCGVIADLDRPGALAASVTALLRDPDRCRAMGARGRALAARRVAWPRVASETEDWLHVVLGKENG